MEANANPHSCKICGKRFPCGRSLGGHMRSHVPASSFSVERPPASSVVPTAGGYGLRENPKKTARLYSELEGARMENHCEDCGKGFPSLKALFGHMRCHSIKARSKEAHSDEAEEEEGSWVPRRKKRSRWTAVIPSPCPVYDLEQQDVAISLMMLSRGIGLWGGFHSLTDSSDKNSVVLEDKGVGEEEEHDDWGFGFLSNGREILGMERKGSESTGFQNKIESDASGDGFARADDEDFQKVKISASDEESAKAKVCSKKKKRVLNYGLDESGKKARFNQKQRIDEYVARFGFDVSNVDSRSRYECTICHKVFHSHQALGGHRTSHKRVKSEVSITGSENNSIEASNQIVARATTNGGLSRRSKTHQCSTCGKVFSSGQALGGHKRSHFFTNEATSPSNVNQGAPHVTADLLDLNLPAPVDRESPSTDGNSGFKPWWGRSNLDHGQAMGMIFN